MVGRSRQRAVLMLTLGVIALLSLVTVGERCSRPDDTLRVTTAELRALEGRAAVGPATVVRLGPDGYRHQSDTIFAELAFPFSPGSSSAQLGAYIPAVPHVMQVALNGHILWTDLIGRTASPVDDRAPLLIAFPPELLVSGTNRLQFAIVCQRYVAELAPLYIGAIDEIRGAYLWRNVMSAGVIAVALGVMLLVAVACFALPWPASERRVARALGQLLLCWAALAALYLGVDEAGSWKLRYGLFAGARFAVALALVWLVRLSAHGAQRAPIRQTRVAIAAAVALVVLVAIAVPLTDDFDLPLVSRLLLHAAPLAGAVLALGWLLWGVAIGQRGPLDLPVAIAALTLALDASAQFAPTLLPGALFSDYAPLGGLILAGGMIGVLAFRMADDARDRAARQSYALERQDREARLGERRRILEDMHDGLGSRLVGLLVRSRHETIDHDSLARELQGGLDDLRLMVDSLEQPGGSLAEALGAYRGRIEPRCHGTGARFVWSVATDVDVEGLSSTDTLQVLRILQEAFANAVRHGHPTEIEIGLRRAQLAGFVELVHRDNGPGFDVDTARKRGLAAMSRRAKSIGATLEIASAEGGTTIILTLAAISRAGSGRT